MSHIWPLLPWPWSVRAEYPVLHLQPVFFISIHLIWMWTKNTWISNPGSHLPQRQRYKGGGRAEFWQGRSQLVQVSAAPTLIQLPSKAPQKAADTGLGPWAPSTYSRSRGTPGSWLWPGSALAKWEVKQHILSVSLFLPLWVHFFE